MKGAATVNRGQKSALIRHAKIGVRRRLFMSFGSQSVAILLRIAQQFLLVPILIRGWGIELYADWIIISSAAGFLAMLDFGLQAYFINALLVAWSKKDLVAYRRLISTAIFIYGAIILTAATVLAATFAIVSWPNFFGTQVMDAPMARETAIFLAVSILLLLPFGFIGTIYRAHGDYSRGTVINITAEAIRGFGICAVVVMGGRPITAALVYLIITICYCLGVVFDQYRYYGQLPLGIAIPKRAELQQVISKSAFYFSLTVAAPLVLNAPVLLLGMLSGISGAVVAYTASRTFTGFVRQIVAQFCYPIGAEMARQAALGHQARLQRFFTAAGRIIGGSAGLLGGFTLAVAAPFLRIWTHGSVEFDPWLVGAFIATVILTAPAQVASTLYLYNNKPGILVIATAMYAGGTLIFCLLLIKGFGPAGAAAGTGLAEFLSVGLILPYAAAKELSVSLVSYFGRSYAAALGGFVLSFAVAWGADTALAVHGPLGLIELAVLWVTILIAPSFFLLLDPQERHWVLHNIGNRYAQLKWTPHSRQLRTVQQTKNTTKNNRPK